MINLQKPLCLCKQHKPHFGYPGSKAECCSQCKKKDMVDLIHKKCVCGKKSPSFGFLGEQPTRCKDCKLENMDNLKNKKCLCGKHAPNFGYLKSKAECCSQCKKKDMVDLIHKKCVCGKKSPSFGFLGEKPTRCKDCKLEKMINLINNRVCECGKLASYNYPNKKAEFCSKCKKDDMIYVAKKLCNCGKHPHYGICGKSPSHCKQCKTKDMIDVRNYKCFCGKYPVFGYEGKKATHCKQCKLSGMVDVRNKRCISEWCDTISTKKYDGYCYHCFVNVFPDHKLSKSYKTKEKEVSGYVKFSFPDIDIILDKTIQWGCSKRRPDIYIDMGSHVVIIEIDENQHSTYENICENKRTMEISKDLNYRPLVLIRFNPDSFIKNGVKIPTCWRNTKNGTALVKTRQKDWGMRLNKLNQKIKYFIEHIPEKTVTIEYLFYTKSD